MVEGTESKKGDLMEVLGARAGLAAMNEETAPWWLLVVPCVSSLRVLMEALGTMAGLVATGGALR